MTEFQKELNKTTQGRLADLGYYKGPIDGDLGVLSENSMSRFKANNGFIQRPYPGPLTCAALWSTEARPAPLPTPVVGEPLWLAEARSLLGVRETPGTANNPQIMGWAKNLDQWYPGDDVPWCGLFLAHCMAVGAPEEPQDFNRLGARTWGEEFGVDCPEWTGSVVSFWRTHKTKSWNGHVGILTGVNDTHVRIIGGNQSDTVSEIWLERERLLRVKGPEGWKGTPAPVSKTGQISTNEA